MRKLKNISFSLILLGFFAMLMHAIIPHHHHHHKVCFDTETSCSHSNCNHDHTDHKGHSCPVSSDCNARNPFTHKIASEESEVDFSYNDLIYESIQIIYLLVNEQFVSSKPIFSDLKQKKYIFYLYNSSGLRAPPRLIS